MPVRRFDGVDDAVVLALGSLGFAMGVGTIAVICKASSDTANDTFLWVGNSSTSARWGFDTTSNTTPRARAGTAGAVSAPTIRLLAADGWVLLAWCKATGTTTPRFHKYNFGTSTWTHEDGASTLADSGTPTTNAHIGSFRAAGSPFFAGDMGIAAAWNVKLTDAEVEALVVSEADWSTVSPVALWPLTQAATTDPVLDTIGAADETALTGTTVVADTIPWAGAAIEVTLTPAATTDTAQSLTHHKTKALTVATVTVAAQALSVTHVHYRSLTPATSTDSAHVLTHVKRASLTATAATDVAQVLSATHIHYRTLTPVEVADVAQAVAAHKRVAPAQAVEANAAQSLTHGKRVAVTSAVEATAAQVVPANKRATVTATTSTDTAQALSVTQAQAVSLTPAVTTDAAQVLSVTHVHYRTLAFVQEANAAQALRAGKRMTLAPSSTTETASALVSFRRVVLVAATATDVAHPTSVTVRTTLIPASTTCTAGTFSVSILRPPVRYRLTLGLHDTTSIEANTRPRPSLTATTRPARTLEVQ